MLFQWRRNTEIVLNLLSVVVGNIILNHLNQRFFSGKSPAIVTLPLEDPPEALHGAVVNAVGYPGTAPPQHGEGLFNDRVLYLDKIRVDSGLINGSGNPLPSPSIPIFQKPRHILCQRPHGL